MTISVDARRGWRGPEIRQAAAASPSALLEAYRLAAHHDRQNFEQVKGIRVTGLYTSGRNHDQSRFVLRYMTGKRAQFVYQAAPGNLLGPVVAITLDGTRSWMVGTRRVSQAPVGDLEGSSDEQRTRLVIQRELVAMLLGFCPDLLERDGLVRFGGIARNDEDTDDQVSVTVADDGGEFGTLTFDRKTHLPVASRLRFIMLFGEPSEGVRVLRYNESATMAGIAVPAVVLQGTIPDRLQVERVDLDASLSPQAFEEPRGPGELERLERELTGQ